MKSHYTSTASGTAESKRSRLPKGAHVLVVGNGMVGARFCQDAVRTKLTQHAQVTVIGAEPRPAYDRIRLSSLVDHRDPARLTLLPREWYEENKITLKTGIRVDSIVRELNTVRLSDGSSLNYDALVLATGSRPFVPPIPGTSRPEVYVYRSIEDLEEIIAAAEGAQSASVLGGGLLGLEAAQALQSLKLKVTVVERAQFLLSQQLNATAGGRLQKRVQHLGIQVETGFQASKIVESGTGLAFQSLDGATTPPADLIVISAGISPCSELAKEAGLPTGIRGGIVVNGHLETEDPRIFAIGECALLHGRTWGLAAPGYEMAGHAAARLAGKRLPALAKLDLSTRLKMLGVDVITIGDPLEKGDALEFEDSEHYRLLILGAEGELRGGLGVGPWPEAGRIQGLYRDRAIIREKEQHYFKLEGVLDPKGDSSDVQRWPDNRIVCNCLRVTKGELVASIAQGNTGPEALSKATGCSTVCGSCRPLVEELCGQTPSRKSPIGFRLLIAAASVALAVTLGAIAMPPIPMAESVESWWYKVDTLWRDQFYKQVSGYSLLGVAGLGLTLSLRKRIRWFRIGHFARWRGFHALFGLVSLIVLFAHTGFRFGHNLNFWLMFSFVGLNLLGALAGIIAAIESKGTSRTSLLARRSRPALTYAHLVLFWPLPVLLTFHILSVYLY